MFLVTSVCLSARGSPCNRSCSTCSLGNSSSSSFGSNPPYLLASGWLGFKWKVFLFKTEIVLMNNNKFPGFPTVYFTGNNVNVALIFLPKWSDKITGFQNRNKQQKHELSKHYKNYIKGAKWLVGESSAGFQWFSKELMIDHTLLISLIYQLLFFVLQIQLNS